MPFVKTPTSTVYGVWDGPVEGEFGQLLRPASVDSPVDRPPDGSATVLEILSNSCARAPSASKAVGVRRLVQTHMIEESGYSRAIVMAPRWHQGTIAPRALKKNKKEI